MNRFISKIPLFLAAVALAAGCAEKYPAPDHVVGVIAKDFTRTAYTAADDTLKGEWKAGDAISVNGQLFLADAAGRSSDFYPVEEFAGPQAPCTAWYPAEIARMELPQTQSWQAGGPFDVPMMATSPTLYLEFKPICGLLEICLSTALEGIEVQTLEISADKPLSGAFRVDEGRIVLTGEAENGIVMDCGAGVPLGAEPVSFWAVLPQGIYGSLDILLTTTDGRTQTFSLQEGERAPIEISRITRCAIQMENMISKEEDATAYLPVGQDFNIAIKRIAKQDPAIEPNTIETTTTDSTIRSIVFLTNQPEAAGTLLNSTGAPVYAAFDAATGTMTISTPASHLHTATDCYGMFRYLAALESFTFDGLETEGVADISYLFNNCHNLKTLDLKGLKTSQIRTMDNAFSYCLQLEVPDLSGFDTRSVRCMRSLFNHCSSFKKLDLRNFRTEQCTIMTYMFYYCSNLESVDLTSFDLQNVKGEGMSYMFFSLPALKEVRTSDKFVPNDAALPTSFFTNSTTSQSLRTGNKNNGITFYTTQNAASWLATTNLRWLRSGYSGKTALGIRFIDINTNKGISVTWPED